MLAQPVIPVTSARIEAALAGLGEVHTSASGSFMVEVDGEIVRVERRADRPFALQMTTRWRRRLPVVAARKLRDLIDALNREGITRTFVSVTDAGFLDVRSSLTHVVLVGASDPQLEGWTQRGARALLHVLARLDQAFPEPAEAGAP